MKFEYSPIGKVFADGLAKEDKSKKVGLFKRLKNIEDNLVEVDDNDNDNKVGIFRIIKDIKDRGIKINNNDEAVREIRERIKELIDDGVKVNSFYEMKNEIIEYVKNLKDQGANVKVDEDQINDLINKIFDKKYEKYIRKTYIESELDKFLEKYQDKNISISYGKDKNKFDTKEITTSLKNLHNKLINFSKFDEEYNKFMDNLIKFQYYKSEKEPGSVSTNEKKMIRYAKGLKYIADLYNIKLGSHTSKKGEGLKILTKKQMLNCLPILLAQIQAGNNSKSLKNELRQILYSLYRSKVLTKTVYNNLIKSICAYHYIYKMETFLMNSKNSKTNEPNRFKYDLIDNLDLKNPNKNMALANLSIYYTRENVKSIYNNNKFKISASIWNETFDLPDGSYNISEIQDYIEYIIKKHETIGENAPMLIYGNTINNRIVFKIKSRYKLELLSKETMKLLGITKDIIDSDKNSENIPKLENIEVVLVHWNLVNNA